MEVAIMIEGQNGLTWQRWMRLAQAVEDLGFAGLYRSDHFTNADPPNLDSLECWVSLTWLASHTHRIEFGPLVTPVSFRHPVFTARMALQVDDLSGGRLRLGVGAGWQVREHEMFGFDLLPERERFTRFEEGLQVMTRLLKSDTPVCFEGKYYNLRDAVLLPRPNRAGGPPLVIGGNGVKRTLPLVACYGDEWNGLFLTAEKYQALSRILDTLLVENERDPKAVRRSLMTNLYFGSSQAQVRDQLQGQSPEDLRAKGYVVGQAGEVVEMLGQLEQAGVQRVILQWLDLDALDGLEIFAKTVVAQVK